MELQLNPTFLLCYLFSKTQGFSFLRGVMWFQDHSPWGQTDSGPRGLQQWHSLWAGSGWSAGSPPPRPRLCSVSCQWPAAWRYDAADSTTEQWPAEPGGLRGEWQQSSLLLPCRSWWTCTKESGQLLGRKYVPSSIPVMAVSPELLLPKCSSSESY